MKEKDIKRKLILGMQHTLAMFGATVLVPALTGLNVSITLLCVGAGTLLFHLITKRKVPVFLGSSFAFISGIQEVLGGARMGDLEYLNRLAQVKGALIVSGLIYALCALVLKCIGHEKINRLLPPIVTGPIIIVIGLRLSTSAVQNAFYIDGTFSLRVAMITVIILQIVIIISVFAKGFAKNMAVLLAIAAGYLICYFAGYCDFTPVKEAYVISLFDTNVLQQILCVPAFNLDAILMIAPVSFVTIIEHVGDITTNGAVVGEDFVKDPGIHRTLLGDGLATILAAFLGGPANTTYGENTGVLAVTKSYDPSVLRIAAVFSILFGVFGKFGGFISSIPSLVIGAISIVLYGMISAIGIRILIHAKLNFSDSRNLMIAAIILVLGIGAETFPIYGNITISGLAVAAIVGVLLGLVLPEST